MIKMHRFIMIRRRRKTTSRGFQARRAELNYRLMKLLMKLQGEMKSLSVRARARARALVEMERALRRIASVVAIKIIR